jgi:uncharacterized protein
MYLICSQPGYASNTPAQMLFMYHESTLTLHMAYFKSALFVFILVWGTTACRQDAPAADKTAPVANTPAKSAPVMAVNDPNSTVPEPPFTQEGRLVILAADGKKKIEQFNIEIADNESQRQQGLMYRRKMDPKQAMLFTFDRTAEQAFWMRNTYIPLDILYIDEQLQVVSIQKNCKTLNDTPLPSGKPAMYVLEINGGLSDQLGITPGAKIAWQSFITNSTKGNYEFPSL